MCSCSGCVVFELGCVQRMVKNKHNKKPTTLLRLVSTLVGCVFIIHLIMLYRRNCSVDNLEVSSQLLIHHPVVHELERVEEENIRMPPPRKRSPRAIKRKPKRPTTLVEEFLDENSQIRHLFFPDMTSSFGPTKDGGNNDTLHRFFPGKIWLDTEGNPIQAHGGGMLYDEKSKSYYWYGEYKDGVTYHSHKKGAARVSSFSPLLFGPGELLGIKINKNKICLKQFIGFVFRLI